MTCTCGCGAEFTNPDVHGVPLVNPLMCPACRDRRRVAAILAENIACLRRGGFPVYLIRRMGLHLTEAEYAVACARRDAQTTDCNAIGKDMEAMIAKLSANRPIDHKVAAAAHAIFGRVNPLTIDYFGNPETGIDESATVRECIGGTPKRCTIELATLPK